MADGGVEGAAFTNLVGVNHWVIHHWRFVGNEAGGIQIAQHFHFTGAARAVFPVVPLVAQCPVRTYVVDQRIGGFFYQDFGFRDAVVVILKFRARQQGAGEPEPVVLGIRRRMGADPAAAVFNIGLEGGFLVCIKNIAGGVHKYDGAVVGEIGCGEQAGIFRCRYRIAIIRRDLLHHGDTGRNRVVPEPGGFGE